MPYDLRTQTALVCGALALAIALSALLTSGPKRVHVYFSAFSGTIGLWYLAQAFYGIFEGSAIWERSTAMLALVLPQFALALFDAMLPRETARTSRLLRVAQVLAVPLLILLLSPLFRAPTFKFFVFLYVFTFVTLGLFQLGRRGKASPSRAVQRRVQYLVLIGAMSGIATIIDFAWYPLRARTPPIGAVFAIVLVFALSQSLRSERLLDLYEMVGRLLVSAAVAFLIVGIFYALLSFRGFNTVYLNAVLAATVVLVLFDPLRARVEGQLQRLFFKDRFDLEKALADVRQRLVHTLDVAEMSSLVLSAFERSRRVTTAAIYVTDADATGFDRIGELGLGAPLRIEVATARVLLDELQVGSVRLEPIVNELNERKRVGDRVDRLEALVSAAEVLGVFRSGLVVAVRDKERELVGLVALKDDRVKDAFSLEEISLLEHLATQVGVVIENSRVYTQMKERDRLAVLGQMAAGLAHEIRNPLGAIKGAAQLLAEPTPDGTAEGSREFIGIILEEVDRLNRVVGNVLDLARPSVTGVVPVDVNSVIRRTLQVLSADRTSEEVELSVVLDAELPRVAIDPELLRQVLMNLVKNALQAIREGGKVSLSTRVRVGRGTRSGKSSDESFVEINVSDTGPGMSQKTLDKLFLPFFTTKDKGTGLGLAISQRIVQGAGGRIEVRSYEGKGSTFTIVLPVAMEALGTPNPGKALPSDERTVS